MKARNVIATLVTAVFLFGCGGESGGSSDSGSNGGGDIIDNSGGGDTPLAPALGTISGCSTTIVGYYDASGVINDFAFKCDTFEVDDGYFAVTDYSSVGGWSTGFSSNNIDGAGTYQDESFAFINFSARPLMTLSAELEADFNYTIEVRIFENDTSLIYQGDNVPAKNVGNTAPVGIIKVPVVIHKTVGVVSKIDVSAGAVEIPLLNILVEFNDVQLATTDSDWNSRMFSLDKFNLNNFMSRNTQGQLTFKPVNENSGVQDDGVVRLSLDKNHPSFRDSNFVCHDNLGIDLLEPEIMQLTDAYVDFSQYDVNSDGKISSQELAINIIVAGHERANNPLFCEGSVWASGAYGGRTIYNYTYDGVVLFDGFGTMVMGEMISKVGTYTIPKEVMGTDNDYTYTQDYNIMASVGVVAHELGHTLFGLIDLYDYDSSSNGGIDGFSLMSAGTHGSEVQTIDGNDLLVSGNSPALLDAYSQIASGLEEPEVVSVSTNDITVYPPDGTSSYNIIKLMNGRNDVYFLVENYEKVATRGNPRIEGRTTQLWGDEDGGLLVSAINENTTGNTEDDNRRVNIMHAQGVPMVDYEDGNGLVEYTYYTAPAKSLFTTGDEMNASSLSGNNFSDGTASGIEITNVRRNVDKSITFNVIIN